MLLSLMMESVKNSTKVMEYYIKQVALTNHNKWNGRKEAHKHT